MQEIVEFFSKRSFVAVKFWTEKIICREKLYQKFGSGQTWYKNGPQLSQTPDQEKIFSGGPCAYGCLILKLPIIRYLIQDFENQCCLRLFLLGSRKHILQYDSRTKRRPTSVAMLRPISDRLIGHVDGLNRTIPDHFVKNFWSMALALMFANIACFFSCMSRPTLAPHPLRMFLSLQDALCQWSKIICWDIGGHR